MGVVPGWVPSTILDVKIPLQELSKLDVKTKCVLTSEFDVKDAISYDAFLLHRLVEPKDLRVVLKIREIGKGFVYQTDDNFLDISPQSEIGAYHRHPARIFTFIEMIRMSLGVRVYSDILANKLFPFNSHVIKIDPYFFSKHPIREKKICKERVPRIVYMTSRGKDEVLGEFVWKVLQGVYDKYGNAVDIFVWGADLDNGHSFVKKIEFTKNYDDYLRQAQEYDFDIGLAPLLNDDFHNSKTNNKFREFAALGIAGVYADVPLYRSCVEGDINGILVETQVAKWVNAIGRLVENDDLRRKITTSAKRDLNEKYSFEKYLNTFQRNFSDLYDSKADGEISEKLIDKIQVFFDGKARASKDFIQLKENLQEVFYYFGVRLVWKKYSLSTAKAGQNSNSIFIFGANKNIENLVDCGGTGVVIGFCSSRGDQKFNRDICFLDSYSFELYADYKNNIYIEILNKLLSGKSLSLPVVIKGKTPVMLKIERRLKKILRKYLPIIR